MSCPPNSGFCRQDVPLMAVIAVLTVSSLGDVFMLYALIHWMRDDARNPPPIDRCASHFLK